MAMREVREMCIWRGIWRWVYPYLAILYGIVSYGEREGERERERETNLHYKLMGSRDQRQRVVVVKGLRDVLAKGVTGSSRGNAPAAAIVGIRPQQIAHGSLVGYLLNAVQGANVVQRVNGGRETAVQAEDLRVGVGMGVFKSTLHNL